MKPIVFLDTETCGLALDDPIWDIALIRRDDSGETAHQWYVEHDLAAAESLPAFFKKDHDERYRADEALSPDATKARLEELLAPGEDGKAIIVGSAVDFDMYRIQHQFGIDQIWNHHLVDAPTLAMGWWFHDHKARLSFPPSLDEAAKMHRINQKALRHTAMRDVEITRDIFDRATHGRYGEVAA